MSFIIIKTLNTRTMKTITNIILAVIFGLTALSSSGQNNTNLLDPGKMWSSVEWIPWGGWYYKTYYNRFDEDTIINDITYKKIWQAEDENHSNWYLFGFIRLDSAGDILVRNLSGNEGLIYNFDLAVNDSVTIHNPFYQIEYTTYVSQIDTIVIQPGDIYRKRITLASVDFFGKNEYWIEGVGSVAGILWSGLHALSLTGSNNDLNCHWENSVLVFKTNIFTGCYVTTVSVDTHEAGEVLYIYPLPVTSQSIVHFEGLPGNNYHFEIWNMFGQTVMARSISVRDKEILTRGQMKQGVYILVLKKNGEMIKCVKFNVL
jgi:hypothetical protein